VKINGHNNGSPHLKKADQGMKRLQIIALSAGIFAITGFGVSEWANVFHKTGMDHSIQWSWQHSITETSQELQQIMRVPFMRVPFTHSKAYNAITQHAIEEGIKHAYPDHSKSIVDWSKRLE
jgi:hypothetical protein